MSPWEQSEEQDACGKTWEAVLVALKYFEGCQEEDFSQEHGRQKSTIKDENHKKQIYNREGVKGNLI